MRNLKIIFDVFTQAKSSNERRFGGTGLGLSITKKIIQLMDSKIFVESKLGIGSKFYFKLEFDKFISVDQADEVPSILEKEANLEGVKILLVEDNEVNIFLAIKFLQKWKIEYSVAKNGIEAVQSIKSKECDLILMDLQMSEMEGFEATKHIRNMEDPYFKNIQIAKSQDFFIEK